MVFRSFGEEAVRPLEFDVKNLQTVEDGRWGVCDCFKPTGVDNSN